MTVYSRIVNLDQLSISVKSRHILMRNFRLKCGYSGLLTDKQRRVLSVYLGQMWHYTDPYDFEKRTRVFLNFLNLVNFANGKRRNASSPVVSPQVDLVQVFRELASLHPEGSPENVEVVCEDVIYSDNKNISIPSTQQSVHRSSNTCDASPLRCLVLTNIHDPHSPIPGTTPPPIDNHPPQFLEERDSDAQPVSPTSPAHQTHHPAVPEIVNSDSLQDVNRHSPASTEVISTLEYDFVPYAQELWDSNQSMIRVMQAETSYIVVDDLPAGVAFED